MVMVKRSLEAAKAIKAGNNSNLTASINMSIVLAADKERIAGVRPD
jgi:hypothetical protein